MVIPKARKSTFVKIHDDFLSLVRFAFFAEDSMSIGLCTTTLTSDIPNVRRVMLKNISNPLGILRQLLGGYRRFVEA